MSMHVNLLMLTTNLVLFSLVIFLVSIDRRLMARKNLSLFSEV